jgi:hypothetical protein
MSVTPSVEPRHIKAALQATMAVAEAIRELGEVPSGHLYARVMPYVSAAAYDRILGILIEAKLVRRSGSHLLTWIGPAKEEKSDV